MLREQLKKRKKDRKKKSLTYREKQSSHWRRQVPRENDLGTFLESLVDSTLIPEITRIRDHKKLGSEEATFSTMWRELAKNEAKREEGRDERLCKKKKKKKKKSRHPEDKPVNFRYPMSLRLVCPLRCPHPANKFPFCP